jgi:SAM-dependent methyltransferase
MRSSSQDNSARWARLLAAGGPRNRFPQSYLVSWYFRHADPLLRDKPGKSVLDVGCATAPALPLFYSLGYRYSGVDVTEACFAEAGRGPGLATIPSESLDLRVFTPPELPFPNETFDVVIGTESLHCNASAGSLGAAIAEVRRVLKPGGHYFFTTFNQRHHFVTSPLNLWPSPEVLEMGPEFPYPSRVGLRYFVFSGAGQIQEFFAGFSQCHVGEYYYDDCDGRPDGYYLIFGRR